MIGGGTTWDGTKWVTRQPGTTGQLQIKWWKGKMVSVVRPPTIKEAILSTERDQLTQVCHYLYKAIRLRIDHQATFHRIDTAHINFAKCIIKATLLIANEGIRRDSIAYRMVSRWLDKVRLIQQDRGLATDDAIARPMIVGGLKIFKLEKTSPN